MFRSSVFNPIVTRSVDLGWNCSLTLKQETKTFIGLNKPRTTEGMNINGLKQHNMMLCSGDMHATAAFRSHWSSFGKCFFFKLVNRSVYAKNCKGLNVLTITSHRFSCFLYWCSGSAFVFDKFTKIRLLMNILNGNNS